MLSFASGEKSTQGGMQRGWSALDKEGRRSVSRSVHFFHRSCCYLSENPLPEGSAARSVRSRGSTCLGGKDVRETDRRAKVSHPPDCLAAAIDWLNDEVRRTPFGRLSIGVQMHG